MKPEVLVIGGSGTVGGATARRLARDGFGVRTLSRSGAAAGPGIEAVTGDVGRPDTLTSALAGITAVFLVFPTLQADAEATAEQLVGLLATDGRRIVYLSAAGVGEAGPDADQQPTILGSHARLEKLVRQATDRHVLLRPSGFATNTLGWAEQLRRGDELSWIFPQARRSLIHEEDIAAVAGPALRGDLDGTAPHLTGPDSITQIEQLAAIGAATGRRLSFVEVPADRAAAELFADAPADAVAGIVAGQGAFVEHPEPVTDEVRRITGSPARSYAQWARDHAEAFVLGGSGE